jgi:hypothetical protein
MDPDPREAIAMEGQLQLLVDRQKIEQVLIAYCLHLDRMDLTALAGLFTDDCHVDYGNDPRLKSNGAADLAKSLERMWRWARTSHHLSNVVIEFDGTDAALATSDTWLIARRRMLMNGSDAGFSVPINAFERLPSPEGWMPPEMLDKS